MYMLLLPGVLLYPHRLIHHLLQSSYVETLTEEQHYNVECKYVAEFRTLAAQGFRPKAFNKAAHSCTWPTHRTSCLTWYWS